jgi:hypothetical protein
VIFVWSAGGRASRDAIVIALIDGVKGMYI